MKPVPEITVYDAYWCPDCRSLDDPGILKKCIRYNATLYS